MPSDEGKEVKTNIAVTTNVMTPVEMPTTPAYFQRRNTEGIFSPHSFALVPIRYQGQPIKKPTPLTSPREKMACNCKV